MPEELDNQQSFPGLQLTDSQQNPPLPEAISAGSVEESAAANDDAANPKAWGFWPTIGWMVITGVAINILQGVILLAYAVLKHGVNPQAIAEVAENVSSNGFLISLLTCLTLPVGIGILALASSLRWPKRVREYLGLHPVAWQEYAMWIGAIAVLVAITDGLTIISGRSIVPQFSRDIYATAGIPALLWLALVVAAPVGEEIAFRGSIFRGLAASRLGVVGAIFLTSLIWAGIHLQYDIVGISSIFAAGLVLGWARFKTGSTYVPMAMHAAMNLVATIEAALAHNMGARFPF